MKQFFCYLIAIFSLSACSGGGHDGRDSMPVPTKPTFPTKDEIKILVIGQSVSSNCNEFVYGPSENVFQIGRDGSVKPARDPFEWADCNMGAMWMPLGKNIIEAGIAKKVTFMPIGVGSTKVEGWKPGGVAYPKLNAAIAMINKEKLKFDFAFWHQGSSNSGDARDDYQNKLIDVIKYVNSNVPVEKWLVAVHSRCGSVYDTNIEAAQVLVGQRRDLGVYPGPNNNSLDNSFRFDNCHLNLRGQERMAALWLEAMTLALNSSKD